MSDRHELQAAGTHPAPCARHCEATAFEIEIRRLGSEVTRLSSMIDHQRDEAIETERMLRAELSASCEREARTGWRPIDTAPKDGRKVILFYRNSHNNARTVMARWLTDEQAAESDADGVGLEGGWYECIDNWDDYTEVSIHQGEPSHWMPLPCPPSATVSEGAPE